MEFMSRELVKAHIEDLMALKNQQKVAWQGESLWGSLVSWWKSLKRPARKEVSPAYRAELLRQEWVVGGDSFKQTNC